MWKPLLSFVLLGTACGVHAQGSSCKDNVAALDTEYQAAVAKNDVAVMDRLLADDFTLVSSQGKVYSKADLLGEARSGTVVYNHQEDSRQTVRIWGDTAVITALLWEAGTQDGKPFDVHLWFSDTYVCTDKGWRYVFGQAGPRSTGG